MSDEPAYFPEPSVPDPTWGEDDGRPIDWLLRSTLPRAVSIRDALNKNLRRFEAKHASSLAKKLHDDWKSFWFELVVGRWLQELGALTVEHEPVGSNDTRIDYCATFADGEVCVEAVSKRMNLHATPGRAYMDNSEQRIRQAFRDPDKRRQAVGARAPALLAVDGGILASDHEDFDRALLGSKVHHIGINRVTAGYSFNASTGDMATDVSSPWAGVLGFIEPGVFGAHEPILYVSPHFRGHLPFAMLNVRRRMLAIAEFPGSGDRPMDRVHFGESHSRDGD